MSKTPKILYYGVIVDYSSTDIVAVTAERQARFSGRHWYGRLLRPGKALEDAAVTNGTSSFLAKFETREAAEAAIPAIKQSVATCRGEVNAAQKIYDKAKEEAWAQHHARLSAIFGVVEPAS